MSEKSITVADDRLHGLESSCTAAEAMLEALQNAGVSYIFSNLGSDHPTFIEAMAKASLENKQLPKVIICPHEYVALSAAHGFAQVTGKPQAVFVHLDVGTQNLGGAVHNVFRGRIPVLIFAGDTPYTVEGELMGTRNTPINFLQDIYDQRGIVRPYVKWEYEIRTGKNIQHLIYRALQLSKSSPQGPVYLMGAREVLEEEISKPAISTKGWDPIEKHGLTKESIAQLIDDINQAENPLIITSNVGREQKAVSELVQFAEKLVIPVIEIDPNYMNFPSDSPLHQGYQTDGILQEADLIIVIDSDVPWVPSKGQPNSTSKVYYIDPDPLKEKIPLWYVPSEKFYQADSYVVLKQLNEFLRNQPANQKAAARLSKYKERHNNLRLSWVKNEENSIADNAISPQFLSACLREVIEEDTIVLNETITNSLNVLKHLPRTKPGTYYGNGGTSLGWHGGAAIGVKLAAENNTVVALAGDGGFLFSVPSSVHWIAKRYQAPFMTVIYNNHGWNATKQNVLRLHPNGIASQNDTYWVNFEEPSNYAKISEGGGAYGETVTEPSQLKAALIRGLAAVKRGQSAVIDVHLKPISLHHY
ncbi:thiamine pyrophosphate-requiring protein [Bacillus sp. Marseille-P3661]|uniref:thiamine pyrophosphate-requiring protein n=1 Tax=Bacillus sp. Marseille-P3661 TaxID=1936234 RepID=UPI002155EFA6|nr:thiamine pyrophosphate-requiring protein [Bacillus sp. Marseille-P3661]